jgi:ABC-type nitrate/sulfonate/bicarbonate transport system ATPase subunit
MKRRLMIARALINKPEVLILDEPTTGLDPQARHLIWDSCALKASGVTMVLTTHYMEEAQRFAIGSSSWTTARFHRRQSFGTGGKIRRPRSPRSPSAPRRLEAAQSQGRQRGKDR